MGKFEEAINKILGEIADLKKEIKTGSNDDYTLFKERYETRISELEGELSTLREKSEVKSVEDKEDGWLNNLLFGD